MQILVPVLGSRGEVSLASRETDLKLLSLPGREACFIDVVARLGGARGASEKSRESWRRSHHQLSRVVLRRVARAFSRRSSRQSMIMRSKFVSETFCTAPGSLNVPCMY